MKSRANKVIGLRRKKEKMIQCALLSASAVKTVFKSCLSMLNYKMCKGKMSQDPFGRMLPF